MAPLEPDGKNSSDTRPDFWQMIWETKTKLIVMMCSISPGFSGCSQYFPDKTGDEVQLGHFLVKNIETQDHDSYVERSFDLASVYMPALNNTSFGPPYCFCLWLALEHQFFESFACTYITENIMLRKCIILSRMYCM